MRCNGRIKREITLAGPSLALVDSGCFVNVLDRQIVISVFLV